MKHFTENEIDYLKQVYPLKGCKYCSEKLHRTYSSVYYKIKDMGLVFMGIKNHEEYPYQFEVILPQSIDENIIINPSLMIKETAYFIGFFWSDGYITKNTLFIEILKKDGKDIEHIFDKIGVFGKQYRNRKNRQEQMTFHVTNKKIVTFFNEMGKYPFSVESHEKIIKHIPENLQVYFIRGLIDGDGCFFYSKRKTSGHQFAIGSRYNQDWTALVSFMNNIGVTCTIKIDINKNKSSVLRNTNTTEINKLIDYLYDVNDLIYLNRKYEKAKLIYNCKK